MEQLNSLINGQNTIKGSSKYINEDQAQQNAYTNAITNAESLKNKTQNPEIDKSAIQNAINTINTAINNLNGEAKLTKAKQDAKANVNNLNSLTNAQKANENSSIGNATTRDQVTNILNGSQALDQTMQKLRELVNAKIKCTKQVTISMKIRNNKMLITMLLQMVKQSLVVHKILQWTNQKLNKLLIKLTLLKMLYMVPLNFKMIKCC